jgi:phosphoribosyl-ATP pyrophosphohydrolase/phosphoribosyl-AMP cyclohydrolase
MDAHALWERLRLGPDGLIPVVVVDAKDHRTLMLGYMNEEALAATIDRGLVTFWSRSRNTLWEKGETSGNALEFVSLRVDCDADALLVSARPLGPTCHTGASSCWYRRFDRGALVEDDGPEPTDDPFAALFAVIEDRKAGIGATSADGRSYVQTLMDKGVDKINEKIAEEGAELCRALRRESDERVAEEAADLLFHAFVGLAQRDLTLDAVARVLRRRAGVSGLDEKANRGAQ